jgi:hypothetical protein
MEHVLLNAAGTASNSEIENQSLVKQCNIGDGYGRWYHNTYMSLTKWEQRQIYCVIEFRTSIVANLQASRRRLFRLIIAMLTSHNVKGIFYFVSVFNAIR